MTDSIYLLAVLCAVAAVAEWLGGLRAGRWLSGAIISLLLGILLANAGLILNLLSVVDDIERALDHVSGKLAASKWVDGITLIYRKFMSILEANGVSEIKALGEQFDPCRHEAAAHIDGEEGKVVTVIQKGYMMNDRVLRPAMVGVGNGHIPAPVAAHIARSLGVPLADVYGVIEFYTLFYTQPTGQQMVRVCTDPACALKGGEAILAHRCAHHQIRPGETTPDGAVTLEAVYCLGNCALSPAVMLDGRLIGRVDTRRARQILSGVKA